jgi:HEAT repeat protein
MRTLLGSSAILGAVLCGAAVSAAPPTAPEEAARLAARLGDEDFDVREDATRRLLELGKAAIPALVAALTHPDAEVRSRANAVLLRIDPVHRNLQTVASAQPAERHNALQNLSGYRDARLVEAMLKRLRAEDNADNLREVLAILAYQGDRRATKGLTDCLLTPTRIQADLVEEVLRTIAAIPDPAAAESLLTFADHAARPDRKDRPPRPSSWSVQNARLSAHLADALGGTGDPRAVAVIMELVVVPHDGHGGGHVYNACRAALVRLGPPALPELLRVLERKGEKPYWDALTRRLAAQALGGIGDRRALPALGRALADPDASVVAAAAMALDRLGSEKGSAWALGRVTGTDRTPLREYEMQYAGEALAACGHPSLRGPCERLLRDGDDRARWQAAEALARAGEESGFAYLRNLLRGDETASAAVRVLADLNDRSCVADLVRLATHSRQDIVQAAIPALGDLGTPQAEAALLALARGPEMARGYARVKRDSVAALGKIRSRRVVESLLPLLDDPDEAIRSAAHWALVEISGARLAGPAHWKDWWEYHRDSFAR